MDDIEHYIQDSCELLAVALLQQLAERDGLAISRNATEKRAAYDDYRLHPDRGVDPSTMGERSAGLFATYVSNLETHLPHFFARLKRRFPGEAFDFVDVERDARNEGRREDFLIVRRGAEPLRVSLKNYRSSIDRPQVTAGTWNSFIVNFLFAGAGSVGSFMDPLSRVPFRSDDREARDRATLALGLPKVVDCLHEIDAMNDEIRSTFIDGPEHEMYDDAAFSAARVSYGTRGRDVAAAALAEMGEQRIKARIHTLAGLDDGDEALLIDPKKCTDSITSARFHEIRSGARDPASTVEFEKRGQSLIFWITAANGDRLLAVNVPFTINKNGAWWLPRSGPFEGTREKKDVGHVLQLRYGQRRPYKSRELATSVNTYLELKKAGIFAAHEV